jgi:hypothetical protein
VVTKAVIKSIDRTSNRCTVQMPLFESASSSSIVLAEALTSITPGLFNNLFVDDVVFVAFEENAIEKPIIIGKLYKGAAFENNTHGGAGILDSLRVNTAATIPASTNYAFPAAIQTDYVDLNTPKKVADYIKWLEKFVKKLINQLDEHFRCFKNWTQWRLLAENVVVDDGDLDTGYHIVDQATNAYAEGTACNICGSDCPKNKMRRYLKVDTNKNYPNM